MERKQWSEGKSPSRDGRGREGHAKCFGVGILEIIKASQVIVGETQGCSVNEVGASGGYLITCLRGPSNCACG